MTVRYENGSYVFTPLITTALRRIAPCNEKLLPKNILLYEIITFSFNLQSL